MASLALFFVGSVLLCNGLGLLGLLGPKDTAPINLFVGLTLTATVAVAALPVATSSSADLDRVLHSAGFLLFAFTYLYVAVNNFKDLPGGGLGWYCGWAALVSLYLSWVNFDRFNDPKFGVIWLAWVVLFVAFFLLLALELEHFAIAVGWLTLLEAFSTTTIPGALELTGHWDGLSTAAVAVANAIVVIVFLLLAIRAKPASVSDTRGAVGAASNAD